MGICQNITGAQLLIKFIIEVKDIIFITPQLGAEFQGTCCGELTENIDIRSEEWGGGGDLF